MSRQNNFFRSNAFHFEKLKKVYRENEITDLMTTSFNKRCASMFQDSQ